MKLKNIFKFATIVAASATLLGVTSCNYLDVVPPEQPGLADAMKNHDNAKGFLHSCYEKMYQRDFNARDYRSAINASTDEYLITETWYANEGAPAYAILRNTQTTTAPAGYNPNFWDTFYAGIGQTLLFDQQLTTVGRDNDVNQGDEKEYYEWLAESRFCRAYYHFQLLRLYGPIPLTTELIDMDSDLDDYPGRSHFNTCVNWICNELDEAAKNLPAVRETQDLGRATSVICKALKARLLLYAASDLWNGKFPSAYRNWCENGNTNYTSYNPVTKTEDHGLVYAGGNPAFEKENWTRALIACKEALDAAIATGEYKLFDPHYEVIENAFDKEVRPERVWVPGISDLTAKMRDSQLQLVNTNREGFDPENVGEDGLRYGEFDKDQFLRAVWKLRYLNSTTSHEGNTEIIWSQNYQVYGWRDARLPRQAVQRMSDGSPKWYEGWGGVAPTLYTVEHFLNADGTLPSGNITKAFPRLESSAFYSEPVGGLTDEDDRDRKGIVQICLNREPRFYAWIAFDGGNYLDGLDNGSPLVLNMHSPDKQGRRLVERNYSATGFLSMKHIDPYYRWDDKGNVLTGKDSPEVLIRMAELYLNLAEASAEYAERYGKAAPAGFNMNSGCTNGCTDLEDVAIKQINKIRHRAYVGELTPDMIGMTETLTSNGQHKVWTLVEWVRNERFIELWDEGQRYFDVRRWVAGEEYFGYGKRRGLNALVELSKMTENNAIKTLNIPMMANTQYTFHYREYLYPIYVDQVYKNPQMVQNPGF